MHADVERNLLLGKMLVLRFNGFRLRASLAKSEQQR